MAVALEITKHRVSIGINPEYLLRTVWSGEVDKQKKQPGEHKREILHVTVVNLSAFPITIVKIGFLERSGFFSTSEKVPGVWTSFSDVHLPARIEPRDSVQFVYLGVEDRYKKY